MRACCDPAPSPAIDPRERRVLWMALLVNAAMLGVELIAGWQSGSVALWADALDFFGDAVNYGLSLAVLGLALTWRTRVAWVKAGSMLVFGLFVLLRAGWALGQGQAPEPLTMGVVGVMALLANVGVAAMLFAWRDGDANRRSVWLCSRNDAIGNLAVMAAALGVFGTGSVWPDALVAAVMGLLAMTAAASVIRQARREAAAASLQCRP